MYMYIFTFCFMNMYGMYVLFIVLLYCNLMQHTLVDGSLLLLFLYIHTSTCVIFNINMYSI